jgi:hypothetical protein
VISYHGLKPVVNEKSINIRVIGVQNFEPLQQKILSANHGLQPVVRNNQRKGL